MDGPVGRELWSRADAVLPGGGIYLSRSADFAGRGNMPGWIAAAEGVRVTDVDGRHYLDFLCANGPMILGYGHPEVEAAARAQQALGDGMSFYPPALVDWVECLLATFPAFAWGLVGKNGSDVVSLALRIARRGTGRPDVITFERAWHGFDPELAPTPDPQPEDARAHRVRLPWNDVAALQAQLAENGARTAAIVLNPLDQSPLRTTRALGADMIAALEGARREHGVRLILDDVRHGLRLHPQGSHHALGLAPDLLCLGKAIANGYATSALLGVADLKGPASKLMFTASHAFGAVAMRAGIATLAAYAAGGAFARIEAAGRELCAGLEQAGALAGHDVEISGPPSMPTLRFEGPDAVATGRRFAYEAARRGALFHPTLNWFLSAAHDEAVIEEALEIADAAFQAVPPPRRPRAQG
ncbi:MAG TPA: aminotransferase class III-fold pyridoxal phosphate-dependent enzyme [Pseudomonadales bacterium]|nr:aminotransferase class III-fold pyridoxal phosphate-dependent enzyme [Pseudomonadales bacterium]